MKLKTKLAAVALLAGSVSIAQATTYNVSANFSDGGIQGETNFNGTFDWDGSAVTNFSGFLSQSMWSWDSTLMMGSGDFKNMGGMSALMMESGQGLTPGTAYENLYSTAYMDGDAPLVNLTHQIASVASGGMVTTSVFLQDNGMGGADTNVIRDGGYNVADPVNGGTKYGFFDGNTANQNAFFTLVFDAADPLNTMGLQTSSVYGDCTSLGLMSNMLSGSACMTGLSDGASGSMGGSALALSISEVSAVPVPAAAWLFGGALMSLFGANRRKNVLPA